MLGPLLFLVSINNIYDGSDQLKYYSFSQEMISGDNISFFQRYG